ncbi:MAG: hypothetical protein B7Z26_07525 [Asticcacaulis sp. 32-58-5]|nr:MAG: hypothetical protein B7Z26_07525 [Asticcacaulis sp. 32-58-5]
MALPAPAEGSKEVAARVITARETQISRAERLGLSSDNALNATAYGSGLEAISPLDNTARDLLTQAAQQSGLSARGWTRCVRLARTIADLESTMSGEMTPILRRHMAEALIYRRSPQTTDDTAASSVKIRSFLAGH